MAPESLIQFGLRAVVERELRPVFGDAVLESGWASLRVTWLMGKCVRTEERALNIFRKGASNPTDRWVKATVTAMLFEEWLEGEDRYQPPPWEGVHSSWTKPETMTEMLKRLWSADEIAESNYSPGSLFGMIRKEDPLRLAGMKLDLSTPSPYSVVLAQSANIDEAIRLDRAAKSEKRPLAKMMEDEERSTLLAFAEALENAS